MAVEKLIKKMELSNYLTSILIWEMKNQFKDIIRQVEINEIYQIDKFTQMAIEYPELLENKNSLA